MDSGGQGQQARKLVQERQNEEEVCAGRARCQAQAGQKLRAIIPNLALILRYAGG